MENNLPDGWIEIPFTELLDIQGGTQPPKKTFKYEPTRGYIRLLQIRDFGEKPHPTFIIEKPQLKTCEEDDILIARYGASIGRIVTGMTGAYNVALAKVVIPKPINKNFIKYLLKSEVFQKPILNIERSAQDGFNKDDLAEIEIPMPPLPEQNRIVEKLDSVIKKVDSNKKRLENIPIILKRFRQSVLNAAINGTLTEDWRAKNNNVESVEKLLEKIRKEIDKQVKLKLRKKQEQFPIIEEEEKSFELDTSWQWIRLGEISQMINGDRGVNYPNVKEYVPVGVPWINTGHIEPDGTLSKDRMNFITKEKFKMLNGGKIIYGDLVYCLRGATLGKTAFVEYDEGAVASSLVIIRNDKEISNRLIYYLLISPYGKELISRFDNGTAQPNLSANSAKLYPIPLPPKDEQIEIVKRVEQLFAFADKLEARYTKAKTMIDKLPQSILAKAFRGELVAQDPNDEPASVLLERIKKEKEKLAAEKKGKKYKEYSIEESPLKIAAEGKVKYKKANV